MLSNHLIIYYLVSPSISNTPAFSKSVVGMEFFDTRLRHPGPRGSSFPAGLLAQFEVLAENDFINGYYLRKAPNYQWWEEGHRRLRWIFLMTGCLDSPQLEVTRAKALLRLENAAGRRVKRRWGFANSRLPRRRLGLWLLSGCKKILKPSHKRLHHQKDIEYSTQRVYSLSRNGTRVFPIGWIDLLSILMPHQEFYSVIDAYFKIGFGKKNARLSKSIKDHSASQDSKSWSTLNLRDEKMTIDDVIFLAFNDFNDKRHKNSTMAAKIATKLIEFIKLLPQIFKPSYSLSRAA